MKLEWILLTILIIMVAMTSYLFYGLYFGKIQDFTAINNNNVHNKPLTLSEEYPNGMLFYENMRFPDKIISYSIDSTCNELKINQSDTAFSIIQNKTILKFIKSEKAQIEIKCSNEEKEISKHYLIAGEGGPLSVINTGRYYVIQNGTVLLYGNNDCKSPIVTVHEILHVLGFRHSNDENSIMYNVSKCNLQIDNKIIEEINQVYEDPSLPDLTIINASATKKMSYLKPYLNFEIEISNQGLADSENSKLSIYADNKKITEYDIGILEIGTGKIIKVENLKIPLSSEQITFIIDSENKIEEISKDNNEIILVTK